MTSLPVLVLLHHNDRGFESIHYLIRPLIAAWQAEGVRIEFARGASRLPAADLLFPHIDLTVTPPAYRRAYARYPRVVNRALTDISKRRISTNLLGPHDDYEGPVIVKTNRNYGGLPEQRLTPASLLRRIARRAAQGSIPGAGQAPSNAVGWKHVEVMQPSQYPVFTTLREVPREVFANRRLVVEKFIPEFDGENYAIRYGYFLGQAGVCYRLRSSQPATKFSNAHSIDRMPVPKVIEAFRRRQGLDYGKIDFVMRDGLPVVLDVNRTPALQPDAQLLAGEIVAALAGGLETLCVR
jgi:hypothetical protein